jgi:hypothetical protein
VAQLYRFTDENGQTRLMAEISPAPGGGLPAEWTVGADGSLIIASTALSSDYADLFNLLVESGGKTVFSSDSSGNAHWTFEEDGSNWTFSSTGADVPGTVLLIREYDVTFAGNGVASLFTVDRENNKLGFFNHAPAAQPTGVAVTAAGIHAALVTLGLITA